MRTRYVSTALVGAFALSACSTLMPSGQPGAELHGRTVQMVTPRGQSSNLYFRPDGTVVASFGQQQVSGRWFVQNRQLCFLWGTAPRECWPYPGPFPRGRTLSITSDRGNTVQVTLR